MAEFHFEGFGFGDLKFASPPNPQHFSHSNEIHGSITPNDVEEEEWGDFITIPQSTTLNPPQFDVSNGFSHSQSSINFSQASNDFYPFGISKNSSALPAQFTNNVNPDSNKFQKPKGPLPLWLFGEEEDEECKSDGKLSGIDNSNDLIGREQADTVRTGAHLNSVVGADITAKLCNQDQLVKSGDGSSLDFTGLDSNSRMDPDLGRADEVGNDEDDWEFKSAFSANSDGETISKEQTGSELTGSKGQVITGLEKQEASSMVGNKPVFSHSSHEFGDLFADSRAVFTKSSEMLFGSTFHPTAIISNSFMPAQYPGVQEVGNGSGLSSSLVNDSDDFGEFGDYVEAPVETVSHQEEPVIAPGNATETHLPNVQEQMAAPEGSTEVHLPSGIDENNGTKLENHKGALPLSLFSDGILESDDHQDVYVTASNTSNGISTQVSSIPIHDLISNLYGQAQHNSQTQHSLSVDCDKKLTEFGPHSPKTENGNGDFDDGSWEFKDAFSEITVKEQSSIPRLGAVAQHLSAESSDLQVYVDLYTKLRDELCLLVSSLLDDVKSSDSMTGENGKTVALDNEIQEAYKVLQYTEVYLDKQFPRKSCLNEILEVLHGPAFQVVDLEYHLARRLQLAEKDWRAAIELLKHAQSMLKILTLGSAKDQSACVSTWSRIIMVCAQELRHGALIWKLALDKNVQSQILYDLRGQRYFQALGEIYGVVEILRTSAKLYKPWILITVADPISIFPLLDECSNLWSDSGLEEALKSLSNMADSGCGESAQILLESIKYVHDIDVPSMHDFDLTQQRPFCQLSLLPAEIVPGLKMALWNEEYHFLKLANLWVNLISCEPPQLPFRLQVS
ncbi:hypothetical protein Ancab_024153 [Ancistrocladus abbreviatus]